MNHRSREAFVNNLSDTCLDLIVSSNVESTPTSGGADEIIRWMDQLQHSIECRVELIPLKRLKKWYFDDGLNLRHESGRFFSIEGINVRTNQGIVSQWHQPIINQPEIGFLGFICKKIDGILHFLVQAKIEPGNVNVVQLSPTLQATKSNYTQTHKGSKPLFLEYFVGHNKYKIIVDQLQSEQGARFLRKRNRNIIIEVSSDTIINLLENYKWLTLGLIKKLLRSGNLINMDTRTVISSLALSANASFTGDICKCYNNKVNNDLLLSMICGVPTVNSMNEIISWFTNLKMHTDLTVDRIDVRKCSGWNVEEYSIFNDNRKYFEVVGADICIVNREVAHWSQPLVRHYESGIVGLIIKKIHGIYHLLIQAKMEPGNFDVLEMAPTVQCITGSYTKPEYDVPYLDYFIGKKKTNIVYDSLQSEEGGRFYHEQNRYVVVEVDEKDEIEMDERYIWMTLYQAKELIKFNNYLNIELRSLLASISPI